MRFRESGETKRNWDPGTERRRSEETLCFHLLSLTLFSAYGAPSQDVGKGLDSRLSNLLFAVLRDLHIVAVAGSSTVLDKAPQLALAPIS